MVIQKVKKEKQYSTNMDNALIAAVGNKVVAISKEITKEFVLSFNVDINYSDEETTELNLIIEKAQNVLKEHGYDNFDVPEEC